MGNNNNNIKVYTEKEMKNPELLAKYIHKIKNLETIHKKELQTMNQMSEEERFSVLIAYNEIIEYVNSMLEHDIIDA